MSTPRQRGGVSIVLIIVTMVLLMLGVLTFQMGIQEVNAGRQDTGILYLSVMAFSFTIVAMSVLRVRRGYSIGFIPPKVLSVVKCAQCSFKQIKAFALGDYVYKREGRCSQCGNETLFINGIYAEDSRKRSGSPSGLTG